MTKWKTPLLALAALLLVGWAAYTYLWPRTYHSTLIEVPRPAPDFVLQALDGPHRLRDFRGRVVVLFFGYTHCPDVCPTTLAEMKQVMQRLGAKAERVQFIMITVDPERDTPQRMAEYVTHFDPRFLGLSGDSETIARIATQYGIYYQKHAGTTASGYLVDHTASLVVVDTQGYVRLLVPPTLTPPEIAEDLLTLLR